MKKKLSFSSFCLKADKTLFLLMFIKYSTIKYRTRAIKLYWKSLEWHNLKKFYLRKFSLHRSIDTIIEQLYSFLESMKTWCCTTISFFLTWYTNAFLLLSITCLSPLVALLVNCILFCFHLTKRKTYFTENIDDDE